MQLPTIVQIFTMMPTYYFSKKSSKEIRSLKFGRFWDLKCVDKPLLSTGNLKKFSIEVSSVNGEKYILTRIGLIMLVCMMRDNCHTKFFSGLSSHNLWLEFDIFSEEANSTWSYNQFARKIPKYRQHVFPATDLFVPSAAFRSSLC